MLSSWEEYYAYRGLPPSSPCALLLHYPLTLYHLLTSFLKLDVDRPSAGSSDPRKVLVHWVGAERELDIIPLFAELALLLPGTDITVQMVGPSVVELVEEVKGGGGEEVCLVTQPTRTVLDYCVHGRVRVQLVSVNDYTAWCRHDDAELPYRKPDLLFGANAGLVSYPAWQNVLWMVHLLSLGSTTFFTFHGDRVSRLHRVRRLVTSMRARVAQ